MKEDPQGPTLPWLATKHTSKYGTQSCEAPDIHSVLVLWRNLYPDSGTPALWESHPEHKWILVYPHA